jgi:hypothetical protein
MLKDERYIAIDIRFLCTESGQNIHDYHQYDYHTRGAENIFFLGNGRSDNKAIIAVTHANNWIHCGLC